MRICLASLYGEGNYFAWLFGHEGQDASVAIKNSRYAEALKGLIKIMPGDAAYSAAEYDLIVMDSTGNGKVADEARKETPTIGGSVLADFLEEDRIGALEYMQECGIKVAPWGKFNNPADAIRFIRQTKKRYVFKPCGEQDDKSTTYCARDAEDMLRYFDVLFRTAKVSEFVLQEFVEGVEVSTEVWINSVGEYAINHTIEVKKLMNGDIGPNNGCSGSLVWMADRPNALYDRGLGRAVKRLRADGYIGCIDLNTIVTPDGQCYGLEFTPRFGYDATSLLVRLLPVKFSDFLFAIASGQTVPDLSPKHSFCASVRLSIPPYPTEALPDKFYKAGVPIQGLTEKYLDRFFVYDVRKRAEGSDDLESAGLCGWIGSPLAVGETIGAAFDGAENMLKEVSVPNSQYRTDVRDNVAKRYLELRGGGWLKG